MQQWWRDFYCFFGLCGYAAVPGTSIHGWGRAVDFEDAAGELTFEFRRLPVAEGERGALRLRASRVGRARWQSAPEPWHWEHP